MTPTKHLHTPSNARRSLPIALLVATAAVLSACSADVTSDSPTTTEPAPAALTEAATEAPAPAATTEAPEADAPDEAEETDAEDSGEDDAEATDEEDVAS